ncbi:MAG: manganese efflux pump MntP family protein [Clostridiales Family XIII bacterium]|nr:manganese efflux pump MntP family protein [Clostridiales Family XIII bacterium]
MAAFELLLIAAGLSADAFAVSLGNGLTMPRFSARQAFAIAIAFGVFQAIMPAIGYSLGYMIADKIEAIDHIAALVLLGFIGGRMIFGGVKTLIRERTQEDQEQGRARGQERERERERSSVKALTVPGLIVQAIATSIDALIVGVSFAAIGLSRSGMIGAALTIGVFTFALSFIGVAIGKKFGNLLGSKAEIAGGVILLGIGIKIFMEHVFFA